MYENAFFNLLKNLHSKYLIDNISISGGCGMNSVANGKILENTKFKKIYVQSAAGDAGGAIGASMVTWHKVGGKKSLHRVKSDNHAYWGPSFDNEYVGSDHRRNVPDYRPRGRFWRPRLRIDCNISCAEYRLLDQTSQWRCLF